MIANEEWLTDSLAMLGGGLEDAELEQHVAKFSDALGKLREDPDEAARIDAIAADAERATHTEPGRSDSRIPGGIYVPGNHATVHITYNREAGKTRIAAERACLQREQLTLGELLKEATAAEKQSGRRLWGWLPAFGGILVATLAAATLVAVTHASATMASYIGIILASATAITAFSSLVMAWTSVRVLNKSSGGARKALELMIRGTSSETTHTTAAELVATHFAAMQAASGRAHACDAPEGVHACDAAEGMEWGYPEDPDDDLLDAGPYRGSHSAWTS